MCKRNLRVTRSSPLALLPWSTYWDSKKRCSKGLAGVHWPMGCQIHCCDVAWAQPGPSCWLALMLRFTLGGGLIRPAKRSSGPAREYGSQTIIMRVFDFKMLRSGATSSSIILFSHPPVRGRSLNGWPRAATHCFVSDTKRIRPCLKYNWIRG